MQFSFSGLLIHFYSNYSTLIRTLIITLYVNLVEVLHDEALQPEVVLLEAKDEHKGDKVEILQEG